MNECGFAVTGSLSLDCYSHSDATRCFHVGRVTIAEFEDLGMGGRPVYLYNDPRIIKGHVCFLPKDKDRVEYWGILQKFVRDMADYYD